MNFIHIIFLFIGLFPSLYIKFKNKLLFKYYLKSARQGKIESQFHLALIYGSKKNYKDAFIYYKLAADKGHKRAQYSLARAYYYAEGVEQNYKKAFEYYKLAANKNHMAAQKCLADMYNMGEGIKKNHIEANKYYSLTRNQIEKGPTIPIIQQYLGSRH
jgi:TPR repeat protein